ncbi:MAG: formyl-CoA transferase [Acidimicrobiaceae bacterium]|nr:formyl-CoA transferase [Acidimicrobiaceae bacterium]
MGRRRVSVSGFVPDSSTSLSTCSTEKPMSHYQPLAGVKVLDLTAVIMGPFGTQILADMGAEVTVVETPVGDANRHMGKGPHPDVSGVTLNLMRNKRSIVLDLRSDEGRAIFEKLVAESDVFVTNLRPGSRERARVTPGDLRPLRSDLVWVAAAGYDPSSPNANAAAYDDIIQAATGFVDTNERSGLPPVIAPILIADKVSGMALAQAVLAGLFHRERTGEGTDTVLAMYDMMRAFLLVEHGAEAIPEPQLSRAGYPRLLSSERRPLRTSDGGLVVILAYERHHFEGLIRIGGREEMLEDQRFISRLGRLNNIDELYREYQRIAETHTTQEFVDACGSAGVPVHEVVTLDDVTNSLPMTDHPRLGRYRMTPSLAPGVPVNANPRRFAPVLGENGREVLAELGYSDEEIDELENSGVVGRYRS